MAGAVRTSGIISLNPGRTGTREHLAHYVRNTFTHSDGVELLAGAEVLQRLVVCPIDADLYRGGGVGAQLPGVGERAGRVDSGWQHMNGDAFGEMLQVVVEPVPSSELECDECHIPGVLGESEFSFDVADMQDVDGRGTKM